eukprot:350033-Chlamydomonas_euryale.AAC.6
MLGGCLSEHVAFWAVCVEVWCCVHTSCPRAAGASGCPSTPCYWAGGKARQARPCLEVWTPKIPAARVRSSDGKQALDTLCGAAPQQDEVVSCWRAPQEEEEDEALGGKLCRNFLVQSLASGKVDNPNDCNELRRFICMPRVVDAGR